ncbi:MAG TPA: cyclase family protein [Bacillota bacterium]|nr:cyclase family protein [Bacillota bacterium]
MLYDITMPITMQMQVYKNKEDKKPLIKKVATFETNGFQESEITMNLHTGTHIDYPLHMIKGGNTSSSEALDKLITDVKVFDVSYLTDYIDLNTVKKLGIQKHDFILFKTKNSHSEHFLQDFTYLNHEAAKYLKDLGINGVGIDGLGIERSQNNHPTHQALLDEGIIIIEGLRLKEVKQGIYKMICLPLLIPNVDATPARIVLLDK